MKKVIRTGIIEIDTLKRASHKWVSAKVQHLEVADDGTILSESPRMSRMVRRVDEVALETVEISDPVTGQTYNISVAGLGIAIEKVMANWLLEDHQAHYDATLDSVVLDDPVS